MNVNISVVLAFSTGAQKTLNLSAGSTVGTAASSVGAPSGCTYRLNGQSVTAETRLGEGDMLVISQGKAAAGC
jgi:hypothetical protein